MRKLIFIIMVVFIFVAINAYAVEKIAVRLWVAGSEEINGEITTYVERELRSLGDVEVISNLNTPHDFSIEITPAIISSTDLCIVWIYVANIAKSLNQNVLPYVIPERRDYAKEQWKFASITTHNPGVRFAKYSSLKEVCAEIVLKFDSLVLKKERQDREAIKAH